MAKEEKLETMTVVHQAIVTSKQDPHQSTGTDTTGDGSDVVRGNQ